MNLIHGIDTNLNKHMQNLPFLFKYMPDGNYSLISEKIYSYIANHTDILTTKPPRADWPYWYLESNENIQNYYPELIDYFNSLNLQIKYAVIIYSPPGVQGMVHIDGYTRTSKDDMLPLRCLWPIKNCEGSFTKFFDVDPTAVEEKFLPNGIPYLEVLPGPKTEIGSLELVKPVIFNPNIAHGIFTNPDCVDGRISLTVGFYNPDDQLLKI